MRNFKFRAWLNENMYYNHSVNFTLDGKIIYLNTIGEWVEDEDKKVELMQYTGLKDKNGKEIYSGDFVKLSETNPVIFIIEEYFYPRKGWGFRWIYADDKKEAGGYFLDHCEVIGNVWENPELLKECEG